MMNDATADQTQELLAKAILEFWSENARWLAEQYSLLLGAASDAASLQAVRRQAFDALALSLDSHLRSPLFLEHLRRCLEALIQAQKRRVTPKTVSRNLPARSGATPHEVVYQESSLRLLRYGGGEGVRYREPLLICYALVNRPYILDLRSDRSVVRHMLARGFDVYLIDWGEPTPAEHSLRLEDYVCGRLKNVAEFVLEAAGSPKLNLLGYCMGGTMATMFAALFPDRMGALALMAAPIDFAAGDSLLRIWAQAEYFDADRFIDAYGNCPAPFLQGAFQMLKPVQNYYLKYLHFLENLHDDAATENFLRTERWVQDGIAVAGETFRDFVQRLYQRNELVRGTFLLGGSLVDLKRIACPVLLLAAEQDHLVPPSSTFGLASHLQSKEIERISIPVGHVGLAVSSKAHKEHWPAAADWIARHSTPLPVA